MSAPAGRALGTTAAGPGAEPDITPKVLAAERPEQANFADDRGNNQKEPEREQYVHDYPGETGKRTQNTHGMHEQGRPAHEGRQAKPGQPSPPGDRPAGRSRGPAPRAGVRTAAAAGPRLPVSPPEAGAGVAHRRGGPPPFALLSWFDGVGTARLALERAGVAPVLFITWEVDVVANAVVAARFPGVTARGDFTKDGAADIVHLLRGAALPEDTVVVCAAGPPCTDFSRIKGDRARGRQGPEGCKFDAFVDILLELSAVAPWPVHFIIENVIPHDPREAQHFSERLGVEPLLLDAVRFGPVRRPRLWWTSFPVTGRVSVAVGARGFREVVPATPPRDPSEFDLQGWAFHPSVRDGAASLPTICGPAQSTAGRPAPRGSLRARSPAAVRRWLADGRRFAPWAYDAAALLWDPASAERWSHLTPEVKEQLHGLPVGFTAAAGATDLQRHALIANGWHAGVAQFLFQSLVDYVGRPGAEDTAVEHLPPFDAGAAQAKLDQHFSRGFSVYGAGRLEQLATLLRGAGVRFEAGPGRDKDLEVVGFQGDPARHVAAARRAEHPYATGPRLDSATAFTIELYLALRADVGRWREQVLDEIRRVAADTRDEFEAWWRDLPGHVQRAYETKEGKVNIPLLGRLLGVIGFPGRADLVHDLTVGFELLGPLAPGTGWRSLPAPVPAEPVARDVFFKENAEYIREVSRARAPDRHADTIIAELVAERALGRVTGPLAAPPGWGFATVGLDPGGPVDPAPVEPVGAALAFAIVTERDDGSLKVRRGEDWRRSGHNATTQVTDRPGHNDVDFYIDVARALSARGVGQVHGWTHDHFGAYRQLPLRRPADACCVVLAERGPTLWMHAVLLFGAKGAVWGYGRFADALAALTRLLLAAPAGHYVDDFGGAEAATTASSAADGFADLNAAMGFRIQPAKAVAPAAAFPLLGVDVEFKATVAVTSPRPARVRRITADIDQALASDRLSSTAAGRLAGKVGFLATTAHGRIGRALCRPLFARQNRVQGNDLLGPGLRSALRALRYVISHAPPRARQLNPCRCDVPLVYADAAFKLGDLRRQASQGIPVHSKGGDPLENSWGFVVFLPGSRAPLYAAGVVPPAVLERIPAGGAYIFILEMLAQCLPLWALAPWLAGPYVSFVDNTAAQHSLLKGHSRNDGANHTLNAFWTAAARVGATPFFARVASEDNPADAVSRGSFEGARAAGWRRLPLDFDRALDAVARAAGEETFQIEDMVHGILEDFAAQRVAAGLHPPSSRDAGRAAREDGRGRVHAGARRRSAGGTD